jgi:adenine-specific DNA-methyltransferase
MIEGDNLEVLKLLQKPYSGKVKVIYIDPPYNTGKDFVYPDDFQDNIKNYLELTGQVDGGRRISSNTEASGRFHTDWLNMMYPRLKLARNLLEDNGLIFISLDDNELSNLHKICDEVFGEENFIACFIWEKRTNRENRKMVSSRHDYLVCYSKNPIDKENLIKMLPMNEEAIARYKNPDNDKRGLWKSDPATAQAGHGTKGQFYVLTAPNGKQHELPSGRCWLYTLEVMNEAIKDGRIWFGKDGNGVPRIKTYLEAKDRGLIPESIWFAEEVSTNESAKNYLKELFEGEAIFDTPKPLSLVRKMLKICNSDGIVLDFYAGSGTTGHAVMAQNAADGGNRRYILVQLPEPLDPENKDQKTAADFCSQLGKNLAISELTKERLRRAATKINHEIHKKHESENITSKPENPDLFTGQDSKPFSCSSCVSWSKPDLGFRVFKLDTSNINTWDPNRDDLEQTLLDHMEHIKPGRSEADILYELLLKLGLDLCVPIENKIIAGKTVHSIGSGVLFACLAESITSDEAEPLALGMIEWHKTLAPAGDSTCVFRDSAFVNDVAKSNLAAILEQHGISTVRSL